MKILFTGGSSFTGYWFIKELASAGHDIVATFRRPANDYPDDIRKQRVDALSHICRPIFGVSFGDERFLEIAGGGSWDVLCAHGADVTNYGSPDFDVTAAVANNTYRLPAVLDALVGVGCRKIVVTGSVFENDEGAGASDRQAFSPYGLSKAFTWQLFRYHAEARAMSLGKFVIPNPFGPYEERRFTHYLMRNWFAGEVPAVNTPNYVRDNIHVSLLAKAYSHFAGSVSGGMSRLSPSGYVESQGAFTHRFAGEMRRRLGLKCEFELKAQTEYAEPRVRINTDSPDPNVIAWNEAAAWDGLADYYARLLAK